MHNMHISIYDTHIWTQKKPYGNHRKNLVVETKYATVKRHIQAQQPKINTQSEHIQFSDCDNQTYSIFLHTLLIFVSFFVRFISSHYSGVLHAYPAKQSRCMCAIYLNAQKSIELNSSKLKFSKIIHTFFLEYIWSSSVICVIDLGMWRATRKR